MLSDLKHIISSMRPQQWLKNTFVFAGVLFSKNALNGPLVLKVSLGFLLFSLAASAIYLLNDVVDLKNDRMHPEKKTGHWHPAS
jgi:4-hydroxybenzoate polyprenyltransferase